MVFTTFCSQIRSQHGNAHDHPLSVAERPTDWIGVARKAPPGLGLGCSFVHTRSGLPWLLHGDRARERIGENVAALM
jgi:hypothetical protein